MTKHRSRRTLPPLSRRGVVSVLAMMFMVMFSSLAVAMAISTQGNLRTAETHLHVNLAMGAAETGIQVAQAKLLDAVERFTVTRGRISDDYGWELWTGDYDSANNAVVVRGFNGDPGMADVLVALHADDANTVAADDFPAEAGLFDPAGDVDETLFRPTAWARTALVAVDQNAAAEGARPACYQITYAPRVSEDGRSLNVRIIVTGFSSLGVTGSGYAYGRNTGAQTTRPVSRVLQQDFAISKRPRHAILAPTRLMFGKNVMISGDVASSFTDVEFPNGNPMEFRSDFAGLDSVLDARLATFHALCRTNDVDKDNRLRLNHPREGAGIPNDAANPTAWTDATRDGYLDEFDLFINRFDANRDGQVILSTRLTLGTPSEGLSPEFTLDEDLGLMLDSAYPDRNRNGVSGYQDTNRNGRWDPGEVLNDRDPWTSRFRDRVLGWRDGKIDRLDQYAKTRGGLLFRSTKARWEQYQGTTDQYLLGPQRAGGKANKTYGLNDSVLPELNAEDFQTTGTPLYDAADGLPFNQQLATQLGISTGQLATYAETETDATRPRFWRADLDDAYVFARTQRHLYEKMPFNSPFFTDWYYRPRYENMTFRDVEIPRGNNGLFINCTFVGVTRIRSYQENTHANWSLYGRLVWNDAAGRPAPDPAPLDKSDFARYTTGNVADGPANYHEFADPPVIDGVVMTGANRDTKLYSNNLRFHSCTFVGSVVSDVPEVYTHVRNKIQYTGSTRFSQTHPEEPDNPQLNPEPDDLEHIETSSLMTPNYSVDLGSFNAPTDTYSALPSGVEPQNIVLSGTIVAGVLDARGNTSLDGAMVLTFKPEFGVAPLVQNGAPVGNPAGFNSTFGYFGLDDGDGESRDPEELPLEGGVRITGWDRDGDWIPDRDDRPPQAEIDAGLWTPVPFWGYSRVFITWNPEVPMPDGIPLPLTLSLTPLSYAEGRQ